MNIDELKDLVNKGYITDEDNHGLTEAVLKALSVMEKMAEALGESRKGACAIELVAPRLEDCREYARLIRLDAERTIAMYKKFKADVASAEGV